MVDLRAIPDFNSFLRNQLEDEFGSDNPRNVAGSFQKIPADLNVGAVVGSNDGADPDFIAAVMGNVLSSSPITNAKNYLAGLIGHFTAKAPSGQSYPSGGVLAGVGDGSTNAKGAVVAYIDGDSTATTCGALFKAMRNNSIAASKANFGMDLQDAAHDGYLAADASYYAKSELRLTEDVLVRVRAGAPVDGVSGTLAGDAGPGSLLIDVTNKFLYINTNTKASPTWTKVGVQV